MSDVGKPLKVLMVHGYRQNAASFREKSGAFRKLTKRLLEPVFVSAPLEVPPRDDGTTPAGADERGWWFSAEDRTFDAALDTERCIGIDESLAAVREAVERDGPFDGVVGFSQGAALVHLLLARQKYEESNSEDSKSVWPFRFAILVAGFRSRSVPTRRLFDQTVDIPTLHVMGDTDQVIPKEMSEDLLQFHSGATVLRHAGGHFVPASAQEKPVYLEFLERVRRAS